MAAYHKDFIFSDVIKIQTNDIIVLIGHIYFKSFTQQMCKNRLDLSNIWNIHRKLDHREKQVDIKVY